VTFPVLLVVPAFDAASTVGAVVRELRAAFAGSCPVVVVDDGSKDGTREVALEAGAEVIRHEQNRGKGAALRTGFEEARRLGARVVVTVDADGQHPATEALRLAEDPAPEGALVLGVRDLHGAGAPRANRISNAISNFFISRFAGRPLADTQCGLRRYPVSGTLALGAVDDGYAFEAEILLRASRAGWTITEVPIRVIYPRGDARITHFHAVRDPAKIVRRVVLTMLDRPTPLPEATSR
jgi:glycosyltransferase involved in cell wall biosynthesis